jgi:arabinose-5-phosphate isomerase
MLVNAKGRVIVAGMGKSGHVARKIAATFASTGTPAQFVHPAEASHGDLGMVTTEDVALVLSNSGETPELSDLIGHTRRHGIPLIAIASRPDSTLMRAADISLPLPQSPEACPMGLAPTTSTTATLALGDALAVAMIDRRDFQPQNFRMLHPGGSLGSRLLTVGQCMHKGDDLPLIPATMSMLDAMLTISGKAFGIAGVMDEQGRLAGVISDGDLRRNIAHLSDKTAEDIMSTNPKTIGSSATLGEALDVMNRHAITALFVQADNATLPVRPLGLIHIHDCLRAGIS